MTSPVVAKTLLTLWRGLGTPRRISRKRANLVAKLGGKDFVSAANAAAVGKEGASPRFQINAENGLFVVDDGARSHAFAHPERVVHYLAGLAARSRKLKDEYLLDLVPFEDGDHIVDVGANVGDLALTLHDMGKPLHVTAFEPSPREFEALQFNLGQSNNLSGSVAHNAALWSEQADAMRFYLKSDTADSSLLPIDDADAVVDVPTMTLDSALERRPYKLLKLEAEGAEPEILEGAADVLSCFEYVAADVGFERGVRQESTLPQVTNKLLSSGFEVVAVGRKRLVLLFRRANA